MCKLKEKLLNGSGELLRKNTATMLCYFIVVAVLTAAYAFELLKGTRDFNYVGTVWVTLWIGLLFSFKIYNKTPYSSSFRYFVMIMYMVFYFFAVLTSNSGAAFSFIFPIMIPIVAYGDAKITFIMSSLSTLATVAKGIVLMVNGELFGQNLLNIEIAAICTILCSAFLALNAWINESIHKDLKNQAHIDTLTGCSNRRCFEKFVASKIPNEKSCILFADIDNFKMYNDTFGHDKGDDILTEVGSILRQEGEKLGFKPYRYGGDEFVVYTENPPEVARYLKLVDNRINTNPILNNDDFQTSLSWGSAGYSQINGLEDMESIIKLADQNMYSQKKAHKEKE